MFQASGARRLGFGRAEEEGAVGESPHLNTRGFFVNVAHPVVGEHPYPGLGPVISDQEFKIEKPAPLLGQHNWEIFNQLGFKRKELSLLRSNGII